MTSRFGKPRVRHVEWEEAGEKTPMVRLYSGPVFVLIRYQDARKIVDEIHDLADAFEAQQREQT